LIEVPVHYEILGRTASHAAHLTPSEDADSELRTDCRTTTRDISPAVPIIVARCAPQSITIL
jgi:hypothetical protein